MAAMIALPIVMRELRVAARRKSTFWTRMSVAIGAVLFGGASWCLFEYRLGFGSGAGLGLFYFFSFMALLYCLATGIRNSSDSISQEKREGTIGFLFLTDLRSYDIVLGKLFVTGLVSFYAFFAAFPVLAMTLTLGGVTADQFWKTMLALVNIFFFSHVVGIFVSTFSKDGRRAYTGAVLVMALFFVVMPSASQAFESYQYTKIAYIFQILSPGYGYFYANGPARFNNFWMSLLATQSLAWLMLGIASWHLPRGWQEKALSVRGMRWRDRLAQWRMGSGPVRAAFRRQQLDRNPFLWLATRERLGPAMTWAALAVVVGFILWVVVKLHRHNISDAIVPTFLASMHVIHLVVKSSIAANAARHIEEHRRDGSLQFLLCSTALTMADVVEGQKQALKRQFLRPVLAILALDALMLIYAICTHGMDGEAKILLPWWIGLTMVLLVLDCKALVWVGMWQGLKCKQFRRAGSTAFMQIIVLPGIIFAFCGIGGIAGHTGGPGGAFLIWFILSCGVDFVCQNLAQIHLKEDYREHIAPPMGEPLSWLEKIGVGLGLKTAERSN